jgi:hypothetical protein
VATYVLVHGDAHGGWCGGPVATFVRAQGHVLHTPTMTGVGARAHLLSPEIDLDFHIRDILAVLEFEDVRVVDGVELVLCPGTEPIPNYGVAKPGDTSTPGTT